MKIKFVYKILPAFIFKVKTGKMEGKTLFNLIFIKKDSPKEILIHELVHVKQFYRTFGMFPLLYRFSSSKRLQYELEAYKAMIDYKGLTVEKNLVMISIYARLIYTQYNVKNHKLKFIDVLATLVNYSRR